MITLLFENQIIHSYATKSMHMFKILTETSLSKKKTRK